MATITTRAGKGSPLTNAEVDANFTNLNSDKLETAGGTLTGPTVVNVNSSSTALRVTQVGTGAALLVEDEANPDASPLIVNASGNVGIGTTTPGVRLDVAGAAAITVNSSSDALRITQTGAGNALLVEDDTNPDSTPFVVTSAGNVGVGMASPAVKFAVSSTDAVLLPVGTDGQRPSGVAGYLRYNSTSTSFEGHNNTTWVSFVDAAATQTLTNKRVNPRIGTVASAATITPTADTADQYNVTALAASATIAAPSGTPVDGQRLILRIKDNGSPRSLTWTTSSGAYRAVGITLPTTTSAGKVTYVGCVYNAQDTFWDVVALTTQA